MGRLFGDALRRGYTPAQLVDSLVARVMPRYARHILVSICLQSRLQENTYCIQMQRNYTNSIHIQSLCCKKSVIFYEVRSEIVGYKNILINS